MAKFECKCGNILSNSLVPNDVVFHQFSDKQMDKILERDSIETIELTGLSEKIWKCSNCHRIYFFDEDNKVTQIYSLEFSKNST
jgi:hypothetical protein